MILYCSILPRHFQSTGEVAGESLMITVDNMFNDLPGDANWDGVMSEIYVRQPIGQGLKDSEAGGKVAHEEFTKKDKLEE